VVFDLRSRTSVEGAHGLGDSTLGNTPSRAKPEDQSAPGRHGSPGRRAHGCGPGVTLCDDCDRARVGARAHRPRVASRPRTSAFLLRPPVTAPVADGQADRARLPAPIERHVQLKRVRRFISGELCRRHSRHCPGVSTARTPTGGGQGRAGQVAVRLKTARRPALAPLTRGVSPESTWGRCNQTTARQRRRNRGRQQGLDPANNARRRPARQLQHGSGPSRVAAGL